MARARPVVNFGGNIAFVPAAIERPRSADEVLDVLRRNAKQRVRCIGAGHSWNRILATDGVLLDLGALDSVEVVAAENLVRVGAGCTLERLLGTLRTAGYTLPTLGAVTMQTVAGAISTGTHGTGRESLSHFVVEAKVATLDPTTGEAGVTRFREGEALRAARCALGALGVIVELALRIEPAYRVEERVECVDSLEAVLEGRDDWPLQQFALLPWCWRYVVFRRRRSERPGGGLRARVLRWLNFLGTDVLLHVVLRLVLGWAGVFGEGAIRAFYRRVLPHVILKYRDRVDDSQTILTMRHDLFPHVEMELFVPEDRLPEAVAAIRQLVELAGEGATRIDRLSGLEPALIDAVWKLRGSYTLHYPLFFRRVLPDDTLVSMTSAADRPVRAWISISFFTYRAPREDFARFAETVARCMTALVGARVHWGKYLPLAPEQAAGGYRDFAKFAAICARHDPHGRFGYFDMAAAAARPAPATGQATHTSWQPS
ncbi:MAG: FAD-binding protein [Burkholderiales bacterium]|nr:FAD-binding protein [Burkholderiales bacterium]